MNDDTEKQKKPRTKLGAEKMAAFEKKIGGLRTSVREGKAEFDDGMEAMQCVINRKKLTIASLVPPPAQQVAMALMLNNVMEWGIPSSRFEFVSQPSNMPRPPHTDDGLTPTQAAVLDIGLDNFRTTFWKAWSLVRSGQIDVGGCLAKNHVAVEQSDITRCPSYQSVTWDIVDFGSYTSGESVSVARSQHATLPSTSILWAMVYNPLLMHQLRDFGISSLAIGGCRLRDEPEFAPLLGLDTPSNTIELELVHIDNSWNRRSIPTFRQR